jgi:hypothetical protein
MNNNEGYWKYVGMKSASFIDRRQPLRLQKYHGFSEPLMPTAAQVLVASLVAAYTKLKVIQTLQRTISGGLFLLLPSCFRH